MSISNISVCLILCLGLLHIVSAVEVSFVDEIRKEFAELKATTANEINTLRAEIVAIIMNAEDEIRSLRTTVKNAEDEILSVKAETAATLKNVENKILSLEAETATAIKNAEDKIHSLKTETAATRKNAEDQILSLVAELDEMKSKNHHLKKEHTSTRFVLANPLAEKPAFSAGLSNHVMGLGTYQSIIFDKAFTNDLGAYSPITGVFTVPMNGTYFFTATVMTHIGQYLQTEICLNGYSLVYVYSYDAQNDQGTNSVVLTLKAGDSVWVRHKNQAGSNVYGNNYSTFSGFMI